MSEATGETVYLRNLHGTDSRVTLTSGRRIELKPRGQRGDMAQASPEEQKDQSLKDNLGFIYEVLSEEQAEEVQSKQDTNRKQPHSALTMITNELGQAYEQDSTTITPSFEEQGEVVARVNPQDGKNYAKSQEAVSRDVLGPEQVSVPGSTDTESHFADRQAKEDPSVHLNDLRASASIDNVQKD